MKTRRPLAGEVHMRIYAFARTGLFHPGSSKASCTEGRSLFLGSLRPRGKKIYTRPSTNKRCARVLGDTARPAPFPRLRTRTSTLGLEQDPAAEPRTAYHHAAFWQVFDLEAEFFAPV